MGLVTMVGGVGTASAATIDVADGDAAALVAAITTANANGEADTLRISGRYAFATPNNYWYGPTALPPITSGVTIVGDASTGAVIESTSEVRNRLFFVSGGRSGLPAGNLRLRDVELRGGRAAGGSSGFGGGGAGLGGAIYNQGTLDLAGVTLVGNRAEGGMAGTVNSNAGGGMGADAESSGTGGGFGGPVTGGGAGGAGGAASGGNGGGGGGGGGYEAGEPGAPGTAPAGGAGGGTSNGQGGSSSPGTLGGNGSGAGGRAMAGGGAGGVGGRFGAGGESAPATGGNTGGGGGGGVGGGGGSANPGFGGGNGGFGGGGTYANADPGNGGFGGGAGATDGRVSPIPSPARGGFGGGNSAIPPSGMLSMGGGGAGMGGAIFNDRGTVVVTNSTFSGNVAQGGTSTAAFVGGVAVASGGGDGHGAALFNLNGTATLTNVTIAGNTATGGAGAPAGASGSSVYTLGYDRAAARTTATTIRWSAVDETPGGTAPTTTADGGTNLATSSNVLTSTPLGLDLQLAPLGDYGGPTPTRPPLAGSPLIDAESTAGPEATDQRGFARSGAGDLGAVEVVATAVSAVSSPTVPSSATTQNVNLAATIGPARGATSPGAVTFTATGIAGSPQGTISGAAASSSFSVPGGTAPGSYPITAAAAAAPGFRAGSGSGTLKVLKPPPVCSGLTANAEYETAVTVDPDCTGDAAGDDVEIADDPEHGTATVVAGRLRYVPDTGYAGDDEFTYTVTNEGGASNEATVSVTVAPAKPVCAGVDVDAVAGRSKAVTLDCTSAVAQTYAVVDGPDHGTLGTLNPVTGAVTYTADAGYDGPDSFTYRSTNAGGTSNTATVSVTVAPAEPDCAAVDVDAGSGKPTSVTLECTSAVAQAYEVVDGPEHGTLGTLDPVTGEVTYTSDPGYDGSDSFTYRSTNAGGTSNTATVDVEVHPAPTVTLTASGDVELGSGSLTASATVVGRYDPDPDATVDFRLYGPDDATCSAAPVYERLGVTYPEAGGAVEAGTFTPTVAGVYRWRVTYSGDLRNVGVESDCDAASVTVTARPVVPPVEESKPPAADPPVEQCGAAVVLLDVAPAARGRRARVSGIARPALAGQRVTILRNGRSVGTARIQTNGSWSATVAGPNGSRSRPWYAATTNETRTGSLRFFRRMTIVERRGLRATGRITAPASLRPKTVRIDRIDVCSGRRSSTTATVSRTGAFVVSLARPAANEPYALFRVSAVLADDSQTYTTLLAVAR